MRQLNESHSINLKFGHELNTIWQEANIICWSDKNVESFDIKFIRLWSLFHCGKACTLSPSISVLHKSRISLVTCLTWFAQFLLTFSWSWSQLDRFVSLQQRALATTPWQQQVFQSVSGFGFCKFALKNSWGQNIWHYCHQHYESHHLHHQDPTSWGPIRSRVIPHH